jgi:hypothetical protein
MGCAPLGSANRRARIGKNGDDPGLNVSWDMARITAGCRAYRMKHGILQTGIVMGLLVAAGPRVHSEVLNDGSSTNQLVRLANAEATTFGSTTVLTVDAGGAYLVAEQIDSFSNPYPELRTVWYARNATATGLVYRVSAEFRPAAAQVRRQGGVMGWLDRAERRGLILKVMPAPGGAGFPASFQVAHVDFTALSPLENENLLHLYNLDGTPAAGNVDSAWSPVTGEYRATEFVRLELSFDEPTAEELAAVPDEVVTARVTARAFQVPDTGGAEEQLGRTIELLTTLPIPTAEDHRMGYFGLWASGFFAGDVIGHYRQLEAEGAILVSINLPPEVMLVRPATGAQLFEPATVVLEADASDPDGTVTQVEFFEGTTSLGTVTEAPFVLNWTGVTAGEYTLTAVATDNQGDATASDPVMIKVIPWTGTVPTLTVEVTTDGMLAISWNGSGFQLQFKSSLSDPAWTDVPDTLTATSALIPIDSGARYFRLVGSGEPPAGPVLTVERSGNNLVISWPAGIVGYALQRAENLVTPAWVEVQTSGNQYSEPAEGSKRFYRLRAP